MSASSTSVLSVELLLRVIDVEYGYFALLYSSHRVSGPHRGGARLSCSIT